VHPAPAARRAAGRRLPAQQAAAAGAQRHRQAERARAAAAAAAAPAHAGRDGGQAAALELCHQGLLYRGYVGQDELGRCADEAVQQVGGLLALPGVFKLWCLAVGFGWPRLWLWLWLWLVVWFVWQQPSPLHQPKKIRSAPSPTPTCCPASAPCLSAAAAGGGGGRGRHRRGSSPPGGPPAWWRFKRSEQGFRREGRGG
jgi:hypothetical protein